MEKVMADLRKIIIDGMEVEGGQSRHDSDSSM